MTTPLKVDDAMKVGMYAVQCSTVDGRAWQYTAIRFHIDDPRMGALIRKLREPNATINTQHWRPIRGLGFLRAA